MTQEWPNQGWPSCTLAAGLGLQIMLGGLGGAPRIQQHDPQLWQSVPAPMDAPPDRRIAGFPEKALPAAGKGCPGDLGTLLVSLESSDTESTGAFPEASEGTNVPGEIPGGNSPWEQLTGGGFTGDPVASVTPGVPGNPNGSRATQMGPIPQAALRPRSPGLATLHLPPPQPANPGISSQMPGTGLLQVRSIPRGGGYGHQSAGNYD